METGRNVKRILIVKLSALGDIAHALPVVDYIKKYLPDAQIDWVVEERFKELPAAHPLVDNVYAVDTRKLRRRLFARETGKFLRNLSREMRERNYIAALDLQGNIKSALFTLLSRAPRRYGYAMRDVREFPNLLATNIKVGVPPSIQSIRKKLLHVAKSFLEDEKITNVEDRIEEKFSCNLIDLYEQERQRKLLEEKGWQGEPLFGIIHGTTWKTKTWHFDRWVELIELIGRKRLGRILIFWGSQEELTFSERLINEVNLRRNLYDKTYRPIIWNGGNISSLIAALSITRIVIGPDTGPLHLAALIGIPTISFYRSTYSKRNAPEGVQHVALQAPLTCSPCLKKECPQNDLCSSSITAEEVIAHLERFSEAWKKW